MKPTTNSVSLTTLDGGKTLRLDGIQVGLDDLERGRGLWFVGRAVGDEAEALSALWADGRPVVVYTQGDGVLMNLIDLTFIGNAFEVWLTHHP